MKKIFTLLLSSLFSLSLLAYDGNRLSISTYSSSNMDLKVEIDGKKFAMTENSITISSLSVGSHTVRVIREVKRGRGGVFNFNRKQEVIYKTTVFLRKGYHIDITINRFGKAMVDERRIDRDDELFDYDDEGYDDGGYDDGDNDGDWHEQFGQGMNDADFQSLKKSLSDEWFESARLVSVKTIADKNRLSSQQVKELMLLFSFETNRLEIAKYMYRNTVDKNNFHQVNTALSFSSSREELARFIRESH